MTIVTPVGWTTTTMGGWPTMTMGDSTTTTMGGSTTTTTIRHSPMSGGATPVRRVVSVQCRNVERLLGADSCSGPPCSWSQVT
jgi:hypothetical protein